MLTSKLPLKKAETVKKFLIRNNLFSSDYALAKDKAFIYFPVTKRADIKKRFPFVNFVDKKLKKTEKHTPQDCLKTFLSKKELQILGTSFDIVGNILILELPKELSKKEKQIAKAFLKLKNISTVVKKASFHSGEFRLQKYKVLAGANSKETIHTENKARIKLNIEQTYFSPRLATERLRIANLVKPGESVLVMFSGCGPYVLVIAKNSKPSVIYGIEINKKAHEYASENVRINKINNAALFNGDVRDVMPKLNKKFDRIIMPLPKTGQDFLDVAFKASKKGTIIHFYDFSQEGNFPKASVEKIKTACNKANKKFKILKSVKCGQSAPREFRVCVDFRML